MEMLVSFIQTSVEHGYFSTALMMIVCFGCWKLYKAEQERGRDFGTRFAAELRKLINENNEAQQNIIALIKDMSLKQEIENRHNSELRGRLEGEFKELKSEMYHLKDDVKDLKRFNDHSSSSCSLPYTPRDEERVRSRERERERERMRDYDRDN